MNNKGVSFFWLTLYSQRYCEERWEIESGSSGRTVWCGTGSYQHTTAATATIIITRCKSREISPWLTKKTGGETKTMDSL
jgi:hypothetical protein